MRTRLRLYRRIPIIALASTCFAWLAYANLLEDGGFQGAFTFFQVKDPGRATFVTGDEQAQYLVIGFESEPILIEVSDALNPKHVSGFEYLSPDGEADAAYFIYDTAGEFVAMEEAAIPAVSSIHVAP